MSRRQLALLVVPPLLVVLGWVAFGWFPQHQRRGEIEARVEATQTQSAGAVAQLAAARRLAEDADATDAELVALRSRIPDKPDVGGFVLVNQTIAQESGIVLSSVTPQGDIEERFLPGADDLPTSLQPTVIAITGSGSFDAVWAYVRRLTEAERLVVIDSIAMDTEEVGVIRCSLLVRIFSARAETAPEVSGDVVGDVVTDAVAE